MGEKLVLVELQETKKLYPEAFSRMDKEEGVRIALRMSFGITVRDIIRKFEDKKLEDTWQQTSLPIALNVLDSSELRVKYLTGSGYFRSGLYLISEEGEEPMATADRYGDPFSNGWPLPKECRPAQFIDRGVADVDELEGGLRALLEFRGLLQQQYA